MDGRECTEIINAFYLKYPELMTMRRMDHGRARRHAYVWDEWGRIYIALLLDQCSIGSIGHAERDCKLPNSKSRTGYDAFMPSTS